MSGGDEHPLLPRIKALRAQGLSFSAIGRAIGKTKNAVIGIWGRAVERGQLPHVPRTRGLRGDEPAGRVAWSADDDRRLAAMVAAGRSHHFMARRFGCSRGAVATRMRALGLQRVAVARIESPAAVVSPRAAGCVAGLGSPGAPRPSSAAMVPAAGDAGGAVNPAPPRQPYAREPGPRVTLPRGPVPSAPCCQWPEGHPRTPGFRFCEAVPVRPGSAYCAAHHARAYVAVKVEQAA